MENITTTRKVGRIVADDFRTARVFSAHGIDFCCKGGISLQEACETRGLNSLEIVEELKRVVSQPAATDYQSLDPETLIEHIEQVHHSYVENSIPLLKGYLSKLCQVHGGRHPELHAIQREFFEAADALTLHMKKEELILFPYVKAMFHALRDGYPLSQAHFGHVENPIHMMEHEHATEGERFERIRQLTDNYMPPADACQTYRVTFAMLQEFQNDLHTHIHLENNLLFPKAMDMYSELQSRPEPQL
jgi:regulator of cell morphogenesis and NO signaling